MHELVLGAPHSTPPPPPPPLTLEHLLGEGAQQLPRHVQRLDDGAALVLALRQELVLKLLREAQVQVVLLGQRLGAHDRLHGHHVAPRGVVGVHLVRHGRVVPPRHALADGRLHEPRERGQHVDGRVDLRVVQRAVDVDLALGDVARQVGDRVRDVVVGHREDGELRDGTGAALNAAGALVDGRQVRVHVAGVGAAAGHLLARRADLAQRVGVGRHVRQDHEHVHLALVGQVLGRREREARRDDALDGRVVGEVHEQARARHGPTLLKVLLEEPGGLHVHAHGPKHHGKVVLVVIHGALAGLPHQA